MSKPVVLIVDDDAAVVASLALLLKQNGYRTASAGTPADALERAGKPDVGLVLLDMNFSRATTGEEGLALLATLKARRPELPVVLMTAWGSIALAVRGVRAGAADFITKPWTHQQLLGSLKTAMALSGAGPVKAETPTRDELDARYDLEGLVGEDPRFLRVLEMAGRVAPTDASVLITGESGTGKELVAEALHKNSHRKGAPFVKVNLGGVPAQLFESEMFGHVKGAFTDAVKDRRGRFETADGGTIFLDEIGDLDPAAQVKLLRVLQDRTYEVLGSSVTRTVDVRVVSATNRDLVEGVERGGFREDLLYRLNLIALHIPPLRERPGDVPLLARHFLAGLSRAYRRGPLALAADAVDWLLSRPWPGNVRQLRHLIERTVLVSRGDVLTAAEFRTGEQMEARGAPREAVEPGERTLDELERQAIEQSLRRHAGNLSRAAEALGLSRAALYRRLEKYGIEV